MMSEIHMMSDIHMMRHTLMIHLCVRFIRYGTIMHGDDYVDGHHVNIWSREVVREEIERLLKSEFAPGTI